ncbi:NAD(P)-binding protein [Lindgomyces ingoldianus]|uniref:NAD(P)-binding protein n=1 Tax=Lindgomyces ingoldianus TaxID=673940 RepID=A0ACB6RAQ3_9PLEO|nr:NAD(P)-binding protein [Lindgomyces ingoldianus]KAF2475617.1 NAD(P)-binding protein [Lindgomyces ingoldianus]
MSDKTILLITGGNTGIGYETVKELLSSPVPYTIIMGSRSIDKAKDAISTLTSENPNSKSEIVPLQVDIVDDESIDQAYKEVESKWGKIDILVNNAGMRRASFDGIMQQKPGAAGIREAWQTSYSVNVTSTQVMTTIFMPLLLKSSTPRLLFVTSGLSSLTTCSSGLISAMQRPNPPAGWPKPFEPSHITYRSSKTALNMMMLYWNRLLKEDGVKVWCISPGFLATGLGGVGKEVLKKFGAGDASIGGEFIRKVVEGERDADVGKVVNYLNREHGVQPW